MLGIMMMMMMAVVVVIMYSNRLILFQISAEDPTFSRAAWNASED